MKVNQLFILLITAISFGMFACDDDSICLSNQQSVQIMLLSAKQASDVDTTVSGVTIHGWGRDSLIYDSAKVSRLFLPLSLTSDTSVFIFNINYDRDTIVFVHRKEKEFISGSCGMTYKMTIEKIFYSRLFIDSVAIIYPYVAYSEDFENVKIFID